MTSAENDFWASTDRKSSLFDWKFIDSPHSEAFLSEKVDKGTEPITFVSHDAEDGAWQFLGDSMFEGRGVLVCLHHPIDRDPTSLNWLICLLAGMRSAMQSERSGSEENTQQTTALSDCSRSLTVTPSAVTC